jgi:hypothetical protein
VELLLLRHIVVLVRWPSQKQEDDRCDQEQVTHVLLLQLHATPRRRCVQQRGGYHEPEPCVPRESSMLHEQMNLDGNCSRCCA